MSAEEIVRALAARTPIVDDGEFCCTLCDAPGSLTMFSLPEAHSVDCPWRQAYEWCETRGIADPSESRVLNRDIARAFAGREASRAFTAETGVTYHVGPAGINWVSPRDGSSA